MKLKTTDRALSLHLERVCGAVPKEVGEKSSKFRLNDANFLKDECENEDQLQLKRAVNQLVEKLDIISNAIIRNEKFKKQTTTKISVIEQKIQDFLTLPAFREQMTNL